jgi:predicted dehydrogenase
VKKVPIGVVGTGGMGRSHCESVVKLDVAELVAVCDASAQLAQEVGEKHPVPWFTRATDLMDSGLVDAVLIATPHFFHPPIAVEAFKRGLHVLTEKPIAASVKEASRMIRAAERSGTVFCVMFQQRCEPVYQAAKKLLENDVIGELVRTNLILGMYRSQAYYDSGGWRGTWRGEGGGVLLNQAPHGLDLFAWLAGMPSELRAETRVRVHDIEVEDEAFAVLEYGNGAHGYVFAGVVEAPEAMRMEICGDRGKILIDEDGLQCWEIAQTISRFTRESDDVWARPDAKRVEVRLPKRETGHVAIIRNFCRAILHGEELIAPGREGLWSLELANAMILSSYREKAVRLPVKRQEYEDLLTELQATSRPKRQRGTPRGA